jgi:hypothetical protein
MCNKQNEHLLSQETFEKALKEAGKVTSQTSKSQ